MNDNDESSSSGNSNSNSNSNGDGDGDADGDVAFIVDAGTQFIPCAIADWNEHKSISDTRSNLAASAVLLGVSLLRSYVHPTPVPTIDPTHGPTISLPVGVNGIGNTNGTNNINADVAATVVDDDDDDDDDVSDSDTDDDMPELEECRHINNRSRHIIGNRRMFVSHQFNISQETITELLMKKINLTHRMNQ